MYFFDSHRICNNRTADSLIGQDNLNFPTVSHGYESQILPIPAGLCEICIQLAKINSLMQFSTQTSCNG